VIKLTNEFQIGLKIKWIYGSCMPNFERCYWFLFVIWDGFYLK